MKMKWHSVIVAVIVLLLACTGFAGTAAAADWSENVPSSLFYYENVTGLTGTYSNMDEALILDDMGVLDTVASHPDGIYLNVNSSKTTEPAQIMLKRLDAEITMYVYDDTGNIIYSGIGCTVPQGAKVSFKVNPNHPTLYTINPSDPNKQYVGLKFISPDDSGESTFLGTKNYGAADNADRWSVQELDSNLMEGTWTVWAYFVPVDKTGYFASYTPDEYLNGEKYQFTIVSSTPSMSVDRSSVKVGGYVTITVSGKPNSVYYLKPNEKYEVNPGQQNYNYTSNLITIGQNGVTTLTLKAVSSGTFTLQLCSEDKKVVEEDLELTFTKAKITAAVEKDSYYIGSDVKLTGTNEALYNLYYYIEGINLAFRKIDETNLKHIKSSKEWETIIKGDYITSLNLDTAAYTIFISNVNETGGVKDNVIDSSAVYTAVGVNLIKPEIRVTSAPSVVVHGDKLIVKGVADSAANVQYYIFGNNKFHTGIVDTGKNDAFTIEKSIERTEYSAGQYFMVIQHPMYDGYYNIAPVTKNGVIVIALNNSGQATSADKILFTINERQSANAAQALCDAIDSEDVDDVCTKLSFIVAGPTSYINAIPSQITKGQVLIISGATTGHMGDVVIVELLPTAFAAIPRENLPPSVHYILTTTIGEDGVWSIPIDTSYMDADEYSCSVTVGQLGAAVTKVTIVNAAVPTPTPTQTPGPVPTPIDALDISSGTASLSLNPFELVGGYSAEACISISAITANPETRNIKVGLGNLQSLIQGLDMGYFRVSIVTNGIDAEKSRVTINSKYLTLDGGTIDSYGTGVTFGKNSVWNGVNLLDVEKNTESVVFDIVPTSSDAEITIWVCSYIRSDKMLRPQIQISIDDVKTLKKNPNLYFSLSSGQNRVAGYCPLSISKIYLDIDDPTKLILKEGWNFISVPKKLAAVNDTAAELFSGVNTDNKSILIYNAESKLWEQATASTEIKPLNAYWIYSVEEITLTPEYDRGAHTPGLKTLKKGWNAVGLSAESPMPASVAFNGLNWRTYLSWNAAGQMYSTPIVKGVSGTYGEENPVSLYRGGWIYMEEDGTYLGYA